MSYCLKIRGMVWEPMHQLCCGCRFVLQPGMLPEEARLAHDLLQLRLQAATLQEQSCRGSAADFADLLVMVDNTCFRSAMEYHACNYSLGCLDFTQGRTA